VELPGDESFERPDARLVQAIREVNRKLVALYAMFVGIVVENHPE
jgi:hypothetical protein